MLNPEPDLQEEAEEGYLDLLADVEGNCSYVFPTSYSKEKEEQLPDLYKRQVRDHAASIWDIDQVVDSHWRC